MMPVIIISTEIAVRNVPATLREAGLALGAKSHVVSLRIVLPSALTGIVTGVILAISRAIGETAPVLLVIGGGFTNSWKPLSPVSAMPLAIYENAKSEWPRPTRPGVGNRISPGRVRFHSESQRPHLGIKKAAG